MHTPGPWYIWKTEVESRKAWVVTAVPEDEWTPQHRVIATIYGHDEIARSNAELIAKAPSTAKSLQAAKRALSNPAATTKEDKQSLLSLAGVLGDSIQDDLARRRTRSMLQEYTVAPMWRVFVTVCVLWTVGWTCWFTARLVHENWNAGEGGGKQFNRPVAPANHDDEFILPQPKAPGKPQA